MIRNLCLRIARWLGTLVFFLLIVAALTGCAANTPVSTNTPPRSGLPDVPSDIRRCFNAALDRIPDRDMTVAEVEAVMKSDAYRFKVIRLCGRRFLSWYDDIRTRWR